MTRTYSRSTFEEARAAWAEGRFGPEWEPHRKLAALRGFLFPPVGEPDDDRDAESPSQRVIVWFAIDETPATLTTIIGRSHSWGEVVAGVLGDMGRRREDVDLRERDAAWERRDDPTKEQATEALRGILGRLPDAPPGPTPDARAIGAER